MTCGCVVRWGCVLCVWGGGVNTGAQINESNVTEFENEPPTDCVLDASDTAQDTDMSAGTTRYPLPLY